MPKCSRLLYVLLVSVLWASLPTVTLGGDCVQSDTLSASLGPLPSSPGTCCQNHVCGLPCPKPVPKPNRAFSAVAFVCIAISALIGILTYFFIRGQSANFFVAGRTLSLPVVAITLASQSIDSNSLLGNTNLSYKFHFYDGLVLPVGLALSLFLNAIFFARQLNRERVLTLPDVFAKRYGSTVEIFLSVASICSFLFLLAGNIAGMGQILAYVTHERLSPVGAAWFGAGVVWVYTVCGGLFSVAYTDVAQGVVGWTGALACAFWFIANSPSAPAPSVGFPGYIYPSEQVCDAYSGVQCMFDTAKCCFNEAASGLALDNGAYPIGDKRVFANQMTDVLALTPFPNAILWNWATIFILGFGNLAALDFQARAFASKSPRVATVGCVIAGVITLVIGVPFSYLGAITRFYYGPDSVHAQFKPDSCSTLLGLPSCAEWLPDDNAFLHLLTQQAPHWLGAWCLFAIVSASLSTSDGAILALGTVFARNVLLPFLHLLPFPISLTTARSTVSKHMLLIARMSTLPFALLGGAIAAYSDIAAQLLIVAFDIMLATAIAPLFGAFYSTKPSATAALLSSITGAVVRIVLEFALTKDGTFLLPYGYEEFKKYGLAASLKLPMSVDGNSTTVWNPEEETCVQDGSFKDYSGIDSLVAFFASVVVFVVVQTVENRIIGKRLFRFPGDEGYDKMDVVVDNKAEEKTNENVEEEKEEDLDQMKQDLRKGQVENGGDQNI